mmetsp:Transcript_26687/g.56184  ORF Transcript_26687/g.56184 Transcript_26687/m.56184 type:complete len:440 (+) Transcript_26687:135-1454(+)
MNAFVSNKADKLINQLLLRTQNSLDDNFPLHEIILILAIISSQQLHPLHLLPGPPLPQPRHSRPELAPQLPLPLRLLQPLPPPLRLVKLGELPLVLFDIFGNLVDFGLTRQFFAGTPLKLVKGLETRLVDLLPLKGPQYVPVVHSEFEMTSADGLRDRRGDGASGGIPQDLVGPVVFLDGEGSGVDVVEFECAGGGVAEGGEEDGASGGTPEEAVALFVFESLDFGDFGEELGLFVIVGVGGGVLSLLFVGFDLLPHIVKGDVDFGTGGVFGVEDGESRSLGFPRKGHDCVFDVEHFHGNSGLIDPKQLEVVVERLFAFGVPRDLDAQIVPVLLPDHAALGDVKEVFLAQLFPRGDFDEIDVRRLVLVLRSPIGDDVGFGTELKLANAIAGQGALVEEFHGGCFEDGDEVRAHAGEVIVVVAPLEGRRGDLLRFGRVVR